jgi:alpha-2-macroglobulin
MIKQNRLCPIIIAAACIWACPSPPQGQDDSPSKEDKNAVHILNFKPQNQTRTKPIRVQFNKPVAKSAQVNQVLAGSGPFQITPAVPGHHQWVSEYELNFVPSEPYRVSTRYAVIIDESALGTEISGKTEYEFHTKMFTFRTVEPFYEGQQGRIKANLIFTHPVRPSHARTAIRFQTTDGVPIQARIRTRRPSKSIAFDLLANRAELLHTNVEVHVDGGLSAMAGGTALGKKVVRQFNIDGAPKLKVNRVWVSQTGDAFKIGMRFNANVDPAQAKEYISVSPGIAYTVGRSYRGLSLSGAFRPGVAYKVTLRNGLLSSNGNVLKEDTERSVHVPDYEPSISFEGQGNYLKRKGRQSMNIKTVNINRVRLTVQKIYENNLAHVIPRLGQRQRGCPYEDCWDEYNYYGNTSHYYNGDLSTMGPTLFNGEVPIDSTKNAPVISSIPFSQIDSGSLNGVYRVRVSDKERGWIYGERWMLATDLGLTLKSGSSQHRVQVVSLKTKRPLAGVTVKFISRTNTVYGTRVSDANGVAILNINPKLQTERVGLVTAQRGRDFSYLSVASNEISTTDFDVHGVSDVTSTYQAYLYFDRGLFRPGDKANMTAIVRTNTLDTPPDFPVRLEIRDPKWRLFKTVRNSTSKDGAFSLTINIPQDALTGDYAVRILAPDGQMIGRGKFKVEDFMPDRIKVDVKPTSTHSMVGQAVEYLVEGAYLFGAPAAGLRVESRCNFSETRISSKQYKSFPIAKDRAGDRAARVNFNRRISEEKLDEKGQIVQTCEFKSSTKPRRPIRARLYATVSEKGGRAVTGNGGTIIHAHDVYVGIRRNSKSNYLSVKEDASLQLLAIDKDGQTKAGVKLNVEIFRVEWKSILKLVNGRYRYVSESVNHPVSKHEVTSQELASAFKFIPKQYGRFRVDVTAAEGGSKSSVSFWVSGYGEGAFEMSNPDQVSLTLDKGKYGLGENAKLMIRAPFSGTLFLSVERDSVLWSQTYKLEGNMGTYDIPIKNKMLPNAYVVAQLLRGTDSKEKMAPMRAFGVIPIFLESTKHRLKVDLKAPEEIRPNQKLDVLVKVEGAIGKSFLTLAAVDEGILRIDQHVSPDPLKYFSRKRRLGVRTYDLYDLVLPDVEGRATSIVKSSGGDGAVRKKHLNPMSVKRVKPVALWSGLVQTNKEGWGRVKLDVPQFNGQLRLMAVAFKGSKFGASSKHVTVKDPIILTPTLPRFVAPLDSVTVPVEVFNGTNEEAKIAVTLKTEGKLVVFNDASQEVSLPPKGTGSVYFQLKSDEVVGKAAVKISARSKHHETKWSAQLPIRAPRTVTTEGKTFAVTADKAAKLRFPAGYYPSSYKAKITVSGLPVAQFGASLQYLLKYPHGCLEQTTSRAFPLLYLSALSGAGKKSKWISKDEIDDYVNHGINRLMTMLLGRGGFSYWPGSQWGYSWTSIYATHFLVEARKAGYEVPRHNLELALAHLRQLARRQRMSTYRNRNVSLRNQAYALYVLALAKRPERSEMHQLVKALKAEKTMDSESWALVNGALLLSGDRQSSRGFLKNEISVGLPSARKGFGSSTRTLALTLSVLADIAPSHKSILNLVTQLNNSAGKIGRWGTTQENAYALMALGKISEQLAQGEFWGTIKIDGTEIKKFSHNKTVTIAHKGTDWVGKELEIKLSGRGTAFVGIEVEGIRASPLEPASRGLSVRRSFYSLSGQLMSENEVRQGEVIIAKIELENDTIAGIKNIAIVDLLPAGLEIENPRLSDQAIQPWMKKDRSKPEYMDVRDDRLILFASLASKGKAAYYYAARAVSKGEYVLPHVHAEAMYDPMTAAYSGGGRFTVLSRD